MKLQNKMSSVLLVVRSERFSFTKIFVLGLVILCFNLWFILEVLYHEADKMSSVKSARKFATSVGKPILNYGCMNTNFGDVNVDINPRNVPNFELVKPSPAPLPFIDKYFGAVVCTHVKEHVPDPRSLEKELNRVADRVFEAIPFPLFAGTWLFPEHLWVFIRGRAYQIRKTS